MYSVILMFLILHGFPSLLAIAAMFCGVGVYGSLQATAIVTALVIGSIAATMGVSYLLSRTVLKGQPSSFILELPPYRRPQLGKILVRSLIERTAKVLVRAVVVAAPINLVIWVLANYHLQGQSLLQYGAQLLAPLGDVMGLDGTLLIAFVLGLPANEIILPIAMTGYTGSAQLLDYSSTQGLHTLLTACGWDRVTAVCFLIFMLFHAPCATTLLTIHKETHSLRCTFLAWILPLATGTLLCIATNALLTLCGVA